MSDKNAALGKKAKKTCPINANGQLVLPEIYYNKQKT